MPTADLHSMPRSALHYRPLSDRETVTIPPWVPARSRTGMQTQHRTPHTIAAQPRTKAQRSSMFFVLVVLVVMVGLMLLALGLQVAWSWGTEVVDTLQYGYPRTYQVDAVVGHHDSAQHPSHFIALNLKGNIEIVEFPGGDPSHARVYKASKMVGAGADLVPVTLKFTKRAHSSVPDMEVHVGTNTFWYNNEHGAFTLQPA